jgi:TRAP-type C4-dicarboxylate transport system permease small subunit
VISAFGKSRNHPNKYNQGALILDKNMRSLVLGENSHKLEAAVHSLNSVVGRITYIGSIYSGVALSLLAFVIFYGVAVRYLLQQADAYSYVISCNLVLSAVSFSMAYVEWKGGHLRVDLLDRLLPKAILDIQLNIVSPIIGIIGISILTWKGWELAAIALKTGDTFGSGIAEWPSWPARMTIPFGAGLLCLVLITKILSYLVSLKRKNKQEPSSA